MITTPLEKLLKNEAQFVWTKECHSTFDQLKEKLASTPNLIFLNWKHNFHVHVDASSIPLDITLVYPNEGDIDHPISFLATNYPTQRKNILPWSMKDCLWYMCCKSFDTIFYDTILSFLLNTLHFVVWLTR
jgi:hypothetical protein